MPRIPEYRECVLQVSDSSVTNSIQSRELHVTGNWSEAPRASWLLKHDLDVQLVLMCSFPIDEEWKEERKVEETK